MSSFHRAPPRPLPSRVYPANGVSGISVSGIRRSPKVIEKAFYAGLQRIVHRARPAEYGIRNRWGDSWRRPNRTSTLPPA